MQNSRKFLRLSLVCASRLTLVCLGIPQPSPQDSPLKLNDAEKRFVIERAIANLKQHYVGHDFAPRIVEKLLKNEQHGDYRLVDSAAAFASLLTRQMRNISRDNHLELVYSRVAITEDSAGPMPERLARYRQMMQEEDCTFEKVEILAHNIGYLKLNSFPDVSVCEQTARNTMSSLNHVDAIIFDLRDNTGGFPDMVALIAAYLFDHPEYLYNPRENITSHSWTASPIHGNKLADKPVYVLTSSRTLSGAEQFSYNFKMLKRATLVGETTGGVAHAGKFYRIDEHFGIAIPEVESINPYSSADWEGTGVEPDLKTKAGDALTTAERLAASKLGRR